MVISLDFDWLTSLSIIPIFKTFFVLFVIFVSGLILWKFIGITYMKFICWSFNLPKDTNFYCDSEILLTIFHFIVFIVHVFIIVTKMKDNPIICDFFASIF